MRTSLSGVLGAVMCLALVSASALADDAPPPGTPSTTTTPAETTPPTPPPPTDNSAQTPPAQEGDDKIVCKKEPPPIGSRMGGRKVCRTVAEWRRQQAIAKETTDEIQNRKVPESAN